MCSVSIRDDKDTRTKRPINPYPCAYLYPHPYIHIIIDIHIYAYQQPNTYAVHIHAHIQTYIPTQNVRTVIPVHARIN